MLFSQFRSKAIEDSLPLALNEVAKIILFEADIEDIELQEHVTDVVGLENFNDMYNLRMLRVLTRITAAAGIDVEDFDIRKMQPLWFEETILGHLGPVDLLRWALSFEPGMEIPEDIRHTITQGIKFVIASLSLTGLEKCQRFIDGTLEIVDSKAGY